MDGGHRSGGVFAGKGKKYIFRFESVNDAVRLVTDALFDPCLTRPEVGYVLNGKRLCCENTGIRDSFMNPENIRAMLLSGDVTDFVVKAGSDPEDQRRVGFFLHFLEDPKKVIFRIYSDGEPNTVERKYLEKLIKEEENNEERNP